MTLIAQPVNATPLLPPGHHRSLSNSASCAFNLNWGQKGADSEAVARSKAYPSPPMSGSPNLPLRPAQEASSSGEVSSHYATSRSGDGYQGNPAQQGGANFREKLTAAIPMARSYPQEPLAGTAYSYPRTEESSRLASYSLQHPHGMNTGSPLHAPYLQAAAPTSAEGYPVISRAPAIETPYTSPKSQRKTKGHVASACVPCKRAHLRCDAQRPCSRCLGNGKEDACVDVQHKKRGRPRLRDERDARFDQSRFPHPQDVALRRPLNIYPSGSPGPSGYEESLRRSQSYRSLESQLGDNTRQYQDRPPIHEPNMYSQQYPTPARQMEAMAYLSMEFEFVKASPAFIDAIRAANLTNRKLSDIITPSHATLVYGLQSQMVNEQRSKEPNYLPPILGRVDQVVQELGFTSEFIGRFRLERQEYLGFVGSDGYTRTLPLRLGLAKEGSFYFVVILLNIQHPSQSPHPISGHLRDQPMPYRPQTSTPQPIYGDHTPGFSPYDTHRHRTSESMPNVQHGFPLSSASLNPVVPSYAPPTRHEYSGPSAYQTPRSDQIPTSRPATQHSYQLPPIRAQSDPRATTRESGWARDERSGRVDIGGLLERPESSSK